MVVYHGRLFIDWTRLMIVIVYDIYQLDQLPVGLGDLAVLAFHLCLESLAHPEREGKQVI